MPGLSIITLFSSQISRFSPVPIPPLLIPNKLAATQPGFLLAVIALSQPDRLHFTAKIKLLEQCVVLISFEAALELKQILNFTKEMRTELGSSSLRNTLAELKLKLLTEGMHQM